MSVAMLVACAVGSILACGVAWAKGGGAAPPAAAPSLLVEVVDDAGKPVAGADGVTLQLGSSDMDDRWMASRSDSAKSEANGVAGFRSYSDRVCLLASTASKADFVCNEIAPQPPKRMKLVMAAGTRIEGRILGPDGKPAADGRVRVRAPGGCEWRHFDATGGEDVSVVMPAELVVKFVGAASTAPCGDGASGGRRR